ncbi:hypothetical protein GGD63_004746 [Bradyrhizobium sp. cir1]|nr:hypothetical protein [Bradyrhizobium sp. cir1]
MAQVDPNELPNIEAFKYTEEVARNFWLAGVAVLVALSTGKVPGGEKN